MNELKHVENVYSFWGRFSWLYRLQDYITFMGRPDFIRNRAVEKLKLNRGNKVLEVACGNGRNFPFIKPAVGPHGSVVGFDYSQTMLDSAEHLLKKRGWDNIRLIRGDAAELEIGEENFDGILSILGISAIPGWEKALHRCHKILKRGGKLSVCDARLFRGALHFCNPLIKAIYRKFAAWDPAKNIPKKMKEIFGNVEIEYFNAGTMFIAVSTRQ